MGKGWGPGTAGIGYTGRNYCSNAPNPYDWLPAGQPNAACRAPSSSCESRWTLEMVATVEVAVVHLRLVVVDGHAPVVVSVLACSIFL